MSFLPYMLFAGLVIMLALAVGLIALLGVDGAMIAGLSAGAAAGLSLMVFGWFTTLKGIRSGEKKHVLGHVLGGFMLRLVVLAAGFFVLALTGWANPAGFAVAFLMAVMVYLAVQILVALRGLEIAPARAA